MTDRARLASIALWISVLAGCPIYNQDGYILESQKLIAEGAGSIHPAVLEYLFATPTGPLRGYYDAALRASGSKARPIGAGTMANDLASLETDARRLAGSGPPTGEHYARVRARRIIAAANQAFSSRRGVQVRCCVLVDRRSGKLLNQSVFVSVMVNSRARVLHVIGGGAEPDYTWDLQNVPNAFDPDKPLDYETVVRKAIPIHRDEDFQ